jgi:hypothetical protein
MLSSILWAVPPMGSWVFTFYPKIFTGRADGTGFVTFLSSYATGIAAYMSSVINIGNAKLSVSQVSMFIPERDLLCMRPGLSSCRSMDGVSEGVFVFFFLEAIPRDLETGIFAVIFTISGIEKREKGQSMTKAIEIFERRHGR